MPRVSVEYERQRRDQILAAAAVCFARQGYRATTMDDVVRECGLSVGAIYTYFSSKEELFLGLADQRMQETQRAVEELMAQPRPMLDKLLAAVDFFFAQLESDLSHLARLSFEFWSEAAHLERVQARQQARCERLRAFLLSILEEARAEGAIRPDMDVSGLAELLLALDDGLMMHHLAGIQPVPLPALKQAYISLLQHGIGSPLTGASLSEAPRHPALAATATSA